MKRLAMWAADRILRISNTKEFYVDLQKLEELKLVVKAYEDSLKGLAEINAQLADSSAALEALRKEAFDKGFAEALESVKEKIYTQADLDVKLAKISELEAAVAAGVVAKDELVAKHASEVDALKAEHVAALEAQAAKATEVLEAVKASFEVEKAELVASIDAKVLEAVKVAKAEVKSLYESVINEYLAKESMGDAELLEKVSQI